MRFLTYTLMVLLVVSGCISGPSCKRPYTLVYGECCLDENADGICDKDKPVCGDKYVFVGGRCCLDINGNGVCDSDEAVVTVSTSIQSTSTTERTTTTLYVKPTSTSTTLKQAGCVEVADCEKTIDVTCDDIGREIHIHYTPVQCSAGKCIYRSSKEISAYPCGSWEKCVDGLGCVREESTTTTTIQITYKYDFDNILERMAERAQGSTSTTTTTLPSCIDDDGGIRYNVRSVNVTGLHVYSKAQVVGDSEYCLDSKNLAEYYCESGALKSIRHECPSRCAQGRCCGAESASCAGDADCCEGVCRAVGLRKYCL